ncbi:hypothetical protein P3T25_008964 [Paraburkholderia sp. GAS32]
MHSTNRSKDAYHCQHTGEIAEARLDALESQ